MPGKSTLLNAIVGEKIAITSDKPQTTRRAVRGIITRPDAQLVIVDTPGMHRPRTLLGQRLGDLVRTVWSDVDVVGFCIPADEKIGPGDRRIAAEIAEQAHGAPVVGIVTKTDRTNRGQLAAQLVAMSELTDFADIVPVSAVAGEQVDVLTDVLITHLPVGSRLYPDAETTDEPLETRIAELVREAALDGVREELPHSLAALVTEMVPREPEADRSRPTDGTDRADRQEIGAAHRRLRHDLRGTTVAEGYCAGAQGFPTVRCRQAGPTADRAAARDQGLPAPARRRRQGLAARSEAAAQARLRRLTARPRTAASSPDQRPGADCRDNAATGRVGDTGKKWRCRPRVSSSRDGEARRGGRASASVPIRAVALGVLLLAGIVTGSWWWSTAHAIRSDRPEPGGRTGFRRLVAVVHGRRHRHRRRSRCPVSGGQATGCHRRVRVLRRGSSWPSSTSPAIPARPGWPGPIAASETDATFGQWWPIGLGILAVLAAGLAVVLVGRTAGGPAVTPIADPIPGRSAPDRQDPVAHADRDGVHDARTGSRRPCTAVDAIDRCRRGRPARSPRRRREPVARRPAERSVGDRAARTGPDGDGGCSTTKSRPDGWLLNHGR